MIRCIIVYNNVYNIVEIEESQVSDCIWTNLNHAQEVCKSMYPYSIYQDECYNGPTNELFKRAFNLDISGPVMLFYQGSNHVANVDYNFIDFPEEDLHYLKKVLDNA